MKALSGSQLRYYTIIQVNETLPSFPLCPFMSSCFILTISSSLDIAIEQHAWETFIDLNYHSLQMNRD